MILTICSINSRPLSSIKNWQNGNHLACSVQGSSVEVDCLTTPPQEKHRTESPTPLKTTHTLMCHTIQSRKLFKCGRMFKVLNVLILFPSVYWYIDINLRWLLWFILIRRQNVPQRKIGHIPQAPKSLGYGNVPATVLQLW